MNTLYDQWFESSTTETWQEFARTRTAMDHSALETVHQLFLEQEAEETRRLVVEKSEPLSFYEPPLFYAPSHGTWIGPVYSTTSCFYPSRMW